MSRTAHTLPVPVNKLMPLREALDAIKGVDFSSFCETTEILSDDDPFDPRDVQALMKTEAPHKVAILKLEGVKREEDDPPPKPAIKVEASSSKPEPANTISDHHSPPKLPFPPAKAAKTSARNLSTYALRDVNPTIQLSTQKRNNPLVDAIDSSSLKVVKPIVLSQEQERVLHLARMGESLFFTGSAGTGKSVLLKAIIKTLKQKYGPGTVAVTASTGLAACNIGGSTVHSWAGIGLGKGEVADLLKLVRRNRKAATRWKESKVLIIDEISMIDGRLLDKLDAIARKIRGKQKLPFGGLQLVVCGDFYQLPPVSKNDVAPDGSTVKDEAVFAFQSESWKTVMTSTIVLKEVFRQKGDGVFIDMLNNLRNGVVTPEAQQEFSKLSRTLRCPEGLVPTELYATRLEVEHSNNIKLRALPGDATLYEAKDGGSLPPAIRSQMLLNFLSPAKLFLKKDAQVMCLKNFDERLVNGSLGKVIDFVDRDTYMCSKIMKDNPDMDLEEVKKELVKHKVKLELSQKGQNPSQEQVEKAIKSQPSDLLDSVFNFFQEPPQPRQDDSLDDLFAMNKERKLKFIKKLQETSKGEKYPLVRFMDPDGVTTRDVLIEPEISEITDDSTGEVLCSRVQLPLMLAWALSIHKSQGQTLHRVKIDLSRVFENGQAYVALSRAVSRDGLQVLNFQPRRVMTHPVVESFYSTLKSL